MKKKHFLISTFTAIAVVGLVVSGIILCIEVNKKRVNPPYIASNLQEPDSRILFCISNFTQYTFLLQDMAMRNVFGMNNVSYDIQMIEASPFELELHDSIYDSLVYKLKLAGKYDLIITSGSNALDFIENYREDLFPGVPVLFYNLNNDEYENQMFREGNIYGITSEEYYNDTLDTAIRLFPGTHEIVTVFDSSTLGISNWKKFAVNMNRYPTLKFTNINTSEFSRAELKIQLGSISEGSLVFFFGALTDSKGFYYPYDQQISFITNNVDVPVFSFDGAALGRGIIGGKMTNFPVMGKQVAEIALSIVNQEKNGYLTKNLFTPASKGLFYIDELVLNKFKVKKSAIPINTYRINSNYNSEKANRRIIISITAIIIFLIWFIIIALLLSAIEINNAHQLKLTNGKMEYLVEHDFLTGLPNRMKAISVYEKLVATGKKFAVLLIDIDDFKTINDLYSHSCGDEVLKAIASRLLSFTNDGVFFASRFGGDEFLAIYTSGHLDEESERLKMLQNIFMIPITFNGKKIEPHVSIGIVNSPDYIASIDELIADADISMYQSKKNGKNRFTFYNESMKEIIRTNAEISKILDFAVENDGIDVVYQPQVDVETGTISGFEALIRLKDRSYNPSQFIPVAEDTGLISKIGRIITEKVIHQMDNWRKQGIPLYKISINYSYGQIKDEKYADYLEGLMKQYSISPDLICIEITEGLFVSNREKAVKLFDRLNGMGIKLALDDFGTGYSSLSYLTFLPVSFVKIDKSLVDNYLSSEKKSFIKNIVSLVHTLDMKLVVEGVETKEQYETLKEFDCNYIQGYYYSKPISAEEVIRFINSRT